MIFKKDFWIMFFTFLDSAERWQLGLQDPATPIMEGIIHFHNDLMFYLIFIVIFILWMLGRCIYFFKNTNAHSINPFVHGTTIEVIWTTIPALLLFMIAIPSFALLYSMDEITDPQITLKVIGHQWYWSYEQGNINILKDDISSDLKYNEVMYDSYMIQEEDLEIGQFRLLEVDNRIVLPIETHVRVLITSSDVLHSWAIPSLGIKLDACPGRLNQTSIFLKRKGVFYGQCSEICGINHGFMPIVIEGVDFNEYCRWFIAQDSFRELKLINNTI